jgi:hypothetical protein
MRAYSSLASILPFLAAASVLLSATPAAAAGVSPVDATAEQKRLATEHFFAGKRAFESRDFAASIAELTASIDVVDSPNTRLELARALRDAGRFDEAWLEYGQAIDVGTQLSPQEPRYGKTAEVAGTERVDVERRIAFVAITVAQAPIDAVLKVASRVVPARAWGAPVAVLPGAVDVVLEDSRGTELARSRSIVALGAVASVSLDARAARGNAPAETDARPGGAEALSAAEASRSPPLAEIALPARHEPSRLRPFAYVAAGVGVAGLATFAIFGLLSNATYADLKSACPRGCPPGKQSEIDTGVLQQTVANVGLGVGIAGLATGAILFLLAPRASSTATADAAGPTLVVAPGYLGVRGSL